MPFGYSGRILNLNLSTGEIRIDTPDDKFYRTYMGGSGLGLAYLLKYLPAGIDPLGPENILVISVGVLTGAPIGGLSRVMANAKSPLTGAIGDGQGGGFFPAEMKFTGYDAIVLRGRAPKPVYLYLHDDQVEILDAAPIWGKVTGEAEA
ncbi:MAG: aldehyde ferredoxin oxidoreductase N-terminal domain-containing protein, partial [Anaerolineae bacterium]